MRFNWSWNHSISWIVFSSCSLWGVSSILNGTCGVSSGRHRWVEYADNGNYNASAVPPEWHSWLHYISDHTADQVCVSFIKTVSPRFLPIILREWRPGRLPCPTKFLAGHGQQEFIIRDRQASFRSGRFGILSSVELYPSCSLEIFCFTCFSHIFKMIVRWKQTFLC